MRIEEILKRTQPEIYETLKNKEKNNKGRNKKRIHNKEKLNERDIKELMAHSSYRRGSGGALRQK
ncbi:MAG: hypothetical protein SPH93_16070 [Clostridium sp.]|uniref:hypothetical protein n=1 Tax=Clostridium sp. TaxID=1506 RepID=UPI002A91619A|nr:hypothetical protein [Clostridium sp.]MDY6229149.1 hypothetical protein [Clostridium sp.]